MPFFYKKAKKTGKNLIFYMRGTGKNLLCMYINTIYYSFFGDETL